ncbi:PMT family glycosyltransferase, 4-amino-4-deoxy-L-arabinose transferase [Owenweeksia hongkongensis DSM 17368]|uniref:PMT family glycosyltransferase, 4-amino-4-deoxy-L-arabinose transferase n=1 Tax=Owenweeksia hongkongensis (strain DSM 17368 / CIP 108786 / JCM 12287 / NRRL B-23963 / UST20020801) TaxID=926562 RepID=G8R0X6_OWEHD|nr:glycosyltransferase family 39 protein [Owenweeksia hongkongensis]AEV31647.1 PMT family glycosyltransferase, 4-amino-4-deoxy-L-arabinose transferase [Owenweeksia hongkongensis DSM 17368]
MERNTFWWLFALVTIVYIIGLPIDIMDVDSAQYAAISREMAENGNYLQVHLYGRDYLDKPPLLFWITSFFFNVFGYANWSFKIGSFLFTLVGVYSTFRLGKLLYNERTGRLAAIILFSCQAFILFNNDVRTDTILTAAVVFAIWQIMEWLHGYKWKWIIGAAVGIACAMMAKGPIGIMVPVLAVGSWIVGTGRWRDIFRWQYIVLLVLVGFLLSPMLYGLYTQFDLQPEKSVPMVTPQGLDYQKNISGLKFYVWTQSFGRITGENVWTNGAGMFFFVHNFLWSFLPWALMFVVAFFARIVKAVKAIPNRKTMPELLTLGGFILPFIALSMSSYKLPHYIFVMYPLAAILLASWWQEVWEKNNRSLKVTSLSIQTLIVVASLAAVCLIYFWVFSDGSWLPAIISLLFMAVAFYFLFKTFKSGINLIVASVLISIAANIAMNAWFYPNIMKYQMGSNTAFAIQDLELDETKVFNYRFTSFSYYYYSGNIPQNTNSNKLALSMQNEGEVYIITEEKNLNSLDKDFDFEVLEKFGTYPVTLLSIKFLNPETRENTLRPVCILKVTGIKENSKFAELSAQQKGSI